MRAAVKLQLLINIEQLPLGDLLHPRVAFMIQVFHSSLMRDTYVSLCRGHRGAYPRAK